jgi:thiamine biosynthesis lipoprotein
MGTVVSLDVRGPAPAPATIDGLFAWLHEVDATFSTYREDSAIRRLDRGELALRDAPCDVRWVLERCEALRRDTGGFFDVRAAGPGRDPSALVKGWAVQRGAEMLAAAGLADFCLSAGGDVVARGGALPAGEWRVGIQHPRDPQAVAAVVGARDLAVATSGAYARGAHIIDPHSRRPPEGVLSVTVIGADLGVADAYATAAFAMGRDGPDWTLGLEGYEAMTVLTDDVVLSTPGFPVPESLR